MKTCSKCKIEKPFEAFCKNKNSTDGYRSYCAECERLRRLELKKNPLMQLKKQIRSSILLENKLLQRENKRLCFKCKEIFLIDDLVSGYSCKKCNAKRFEEYYKKNKGKRKEYNKEYREKNKEKRIEYESEHIEKLKEYRKEYYEKNKEKNREYMREYMKKYYEKKKKLEKQTST